MSARLVITDGTTTVNLLGTHAYLREWRPSIAAYKDGGLYADSPLADGRRLVDRRFDNAIETFELVFSDVSQDVVIRWTQDLRRLLEQAADYWASEWAGSPVWLEARASQETNTRYALVISGRLEDDDGPYRQPFLQPDCRAVMDGMSLLVERGHWMESAPGIGACLPLIVHSDYGGAGLLNQILDTKGLIGVWPFNEESGTAANNYSRHGDLLDGLYTAGMILSDLAFFTGEEVAFVPVIGGAVDLLNKPRLADFFNGDQGSFIIWMRSSGLIWNDGDEHYILYLYTDANNFLTVHKTTTDNQIQATIRANGITHTVEGTVPPLTSDWVSVGFVWRTDALPRLVLYINGAAVDSGFHYIGNFTGDLVTAIVGAEDLPGGGATPGLSSHIAYAALWDEPLSPTQITPLLLQPDPSSADETSCVQVYAANKRSEAKISHVYYADTSLGSFSANLVTHDYASGSAPLLPVAPAAGDFLYFGSTTATVPAGGPFSSIILDLVADGNACITGNWQYYNGAWSALTVTDHTGALDNPGIGSVHWLQPSDWTTVAINSVTAYWVRLEITGFGTCSVPRQQTRPPYTARRPYLDINQDDVPGDIPAVFSLRLTGWGDGTSGSPSIYANRLHAGLRSLARGTAFTGYINLADRQNPLGITTAVGTNVTFTTDTRSPSGRSAVYNPAGAESVATRVTVDIEAGLATDFVGLYRAFVRARSTGGNTTWTVRLAVGDGTYLQSFASQSVEAGGDDLISFNLGLVRLPADLVLPPTETAGNIQLAVQAGSDNGTDNLNFYDLILIPVDEMALSADDAIAGAALSAINQLGYTTQDSIGRTRIHLDGLTWPKGSPRAILESVDLNGQAVARWQLISPPDLFLQANAAQRLWFYFERDRSVDIVLPNVQGSVHEMTVGAVGLRQARYLSMRGGR